MSSVEEFEKKMDLLAETNGAPPGRWVLTPRKGERFLGPRDRRRIRARRRRRQVFSVLLEATGLTLLIGLFPPLRLMLVGTGILALVLLFYVALLLKLRTDEALKARLMRAHRAAALAAFEHVPARAVQQAALEVGYGRPAHELEQARRGYHYVRGYADPEAYGGYALGNGHANGNGHTNGNGHANANGLLNGNGHGRTRTSVFAIQGAEEQLLESGVRILDDVHVVVRRRLEAEPELEAAAR
ncbi:MAG TPA: hypothetical protein VKA30_03915 [Actinomycetota bacterium]|nr:hypothetical protein [Actinomycetota bacterium]